MMARSATTASTARAVDQRSPPPWLHSMMVGARRRLPVMLPRLQFIQMRP